VVDYLVSSYRRRPQYSEAAKTASIQIRHSCHHVVSYCYFHFLLFNYLAVHPWRLLHLAHPISNLD